MATFEEFRRSKSFDAFVAVVGASIYGLSKYEEIKRNERNSLGASGGALLMLYAAGKTDSAYVPWAAVAWLASEFFLWPKLKKLPEHAAGANALHKFYGPGPLPRGQHRLCYPNVDIMNSIQDRTTCYPTSLDAQNKTNGFPFPTTAPGGQISGQGPAPRHVIISDDVAASPTPPVTSGYFAGDWSGDEYFVGAGPAAPNNDYSFTRRPGFNDKNY
jgi:hypothetical protein